MTRANVIDKRSTCYMCLNKILLTLRIKRFVANHEICDDCYMVVCKYMTSKRLQAQQTHISQIDEGH